MNICIISVGKLKEGYLKNIFNEYMRKYESTKGANRISLIEVEDEKAPENMSPAQMQQVKDREGKRIQKFVKESDFVITLEIRGKKLSTGQLAKQLEIQSYNDKDVVFIIGGTLGIAEEIQRRSNYQLSFSDMTFPHQLARLLLMDQLVKIFSLHCVI